MDYAHDEPGNRRAAADLLAVLWDEARELASLRALVRPGTPPGLDWIDPTHVSGIHLHRDVDGWVCDLTLDGVPAGRPACIGSPRAFPDRDGARASALALLADVAMAHAARVRMPPAPWPIPRDPDPFLLDAARIPLDAATLRTVRLCGGAQVRQAYLRERLSGVRERVFGGAPATDPAVGDLAPLTRMALANLCALGAINGIPRWPPAEAPSGTVETAYSVAAE